MKGLQLKGLITSTLLCVVSVVIFAASGGKNKKKSNSTTTNTANNTKLGTLSKVTLGKISLRSNYEFKGNKLFTLTAKKDITTLTNYTSIKKGNKTTVVASKHMLVKPVISLNNNTSHVNVKLARISLN